MADLYEALVREYRKRERSYQIAKRVRLDEVVMTELAAMRTLQRVLEDAGYERLTEKERGGT